MVPVSFLPKLGIISSQEIVRLIPRLPTIHSGIVTASGEVEESSLRIKDPLQGDTSREGGL